MTEQTIIATENLTSVAVWAELLKLRHSLFAASGRSDICDGDGECSGEHRFCGLFPLEHSEGVH